MQLDAGNYWAQVVAVREEYETKSSQMAFQVEYALPSAVDITVTPGTFDTPTEITWTEAENTVDYEIVISRIEPCYNIENADDFCGEPVEEIVYQKTVVCVDETTNGVCSWSGIFPEGRYEVTVYSINIVGDKAKSWKTLRIIPPLLGDLDFDDVLTVSDARILQQFLTGEVSFSHYGYFERADLNNDEKVNGIDLVLLRRKIANQN